MQLRLERQLLHWNPHKTEGNTDYIEITISPPIRRPAAECFEVQDTQLKH